MSFVSRSLKNFVQGEPSPSQTANAPAVPYDWFSTKRWDGFVYGCFVAGVEICASFTKLSRRNPLHIVTSLGQERQMLAMAS
jgi:hypothetical protein